jgi:hypothetical protein
VDDPRIDSGDENSESGSSLERDPTSLGSLSLERDPITRTETDWAEPRSKGSRSSVDDDGERTCRRSNSLSTEPIEPQIDVA